MAIGISALTTGSSTNATSATTASVSPGTNQLLVLCVSSRTGITANPNQPTATGNGLTWVVDTNGSILFDSTSSSRRKLTIFRAMGIPSTGTIVIDFGGQTQTDIIWTLDSFSSVDTSGTNGSGAVRQVVSSADETGTATSLTETLAAFGSANNATFGAFSNTITTSSRTAGSGFTIQDDVASGTNLRLTNEYNAANSTSVTLTWGASGDQFGGIAMEIVAAAVAGTASSSTMLMMGV